MPGTVPFVKQLDKKLSNKKNHHSYFLQIHLRMFVDYVLPPLDGGSLPPRLPMEWGSLRDALPHVNPSLSSHGPLSQCKLFCCHGDKTPPAVQQFPVPHHPLLLCCLGILCGRPWQNFIKSNCYMFVQNICDFNSCSETLLTVRMVYESGHLCPDPTDEERRQLYPWRVFSSKLGLSLLPSEISVNIKHL